MQASSIEYIMAYDDHDFNLKKKEMAELQAAASRKYNTAGTRREFTRYVFNDLLYEVGASEIKTWRKTPLAISTLASASASPSPGRAILKAEYSQDKIQSYLFPSTRRIYDHSDVVKTTFRIHTNIYINFETQSRPDSDLVHKAYISYNMPPHAKDDPDTIKAIIDGAIALLAWI